jgi:hypothetical protein
VSTDTAPKADGLAPAGATLPLPGLPDLPPNPDAKPDTAPKRPTTRAGRKAASAARAAAKTSKPDAKPKAAKATPRRAPLETRLTGSLVTLGTVVAATGSVTSPAIQADGVLICQHAPQVAAALDKVAKDDPRVAAALERMLTAGVWSGLIAAMLPLVVGIAANHGALPAHLATMLGAEAPEPEPAPEPNTSPPGPGPVGIV